MLAFRHALAIFGKIFKIIDDLQPDDAINETYLRSTAVTMSVNMVYGASKIAFTVIFFSSLLLGRVMAAEVVRDYYYSHYDYLGGYKAINYLTVKSNSFAGADIKRSTFDELMAGNYGKIRYLSTPFESGGLTWSGSWIAFNSADDFTWPRRYDEIVLGNHGGNVRNNVSTSGAGFLPLSIRIAGYESDQEKNVSLTLKGYFRGNLVASDIFTYNYARCPSGANLPICNSGEWGYISSQTSGARSDSYVFDKDIWRRPIDRLAFDYSSLNYAGLADRFIIDDFQYVNSSPPTILLKFDEDINRSFVKKGFIFKSGERYVVRSGVHSAQSFTDPMKSEIVKATQNIFDKSGIGVLVTDKSAGSSPIMTVRFGKPLDPMVNSDATYSPLYGIGYDIASKRSSGSVDWLDRRKDGNVAIFMSTTSTPSEPAGHSTKEIAEIVAHEVGHGFGVGHVVPSASGNEVMDSVFDASPVFSSKPLVLAEVFNETSNPAYVIRRYAIGESDTQLRDLGISPGSWDLKAFELQRVRLKLLTGALWDLGVAVSGNGVEFDTKGESSITLLADLLQSDGSVEFVIPRGSHFELYATSFADGMFDMIITSPNGDGKLSFDDQGAFDGLVRKFSPSLGLFETVGAVGFSVSSVPEQMVSVQLLVGLMVLTVILYNRRAHTIASSGMKKSMIQ